MATSSGGQRLCIALLIDHLESEYAAELVAGVLRATRLARVRTLIVPGGCLARPGSAPVVRNFVYDLLAETRVDGILISAGSLSNDCGLEHFRSWLDRFRHLPSVAIGLDVGTVPSVHVDNEAGMYDAIAHLIEHHRRERIAFIGGPENSPESAARFGAYQRALATHHLVYDERFVRRGALVRESGVEAITELLDERRLGPTSMQAVVGVNDAVALGAVDELNRRGLLVPDVVAVVGFDDSRAAAAASPPLTTVNQRIEAQAHAAAHALLAAIASGKPAPSFRLESQAVIRASCGCGRGVRARPVAPDPAAAALDPARVRTAQRLTSVLIDQRAAIASEVSRAVRGRLTGSSHWEVRLLSSLVQDLTTDGSEAFPRELEAMARRHLARGHDDVEVCHEILSAFRRQTLAYATVEPNVRPRLEEGFEASRLMLARLGVESARAQQACLALRFRALVNGCLSLFGNVRPEEFARLLRENLPAMGIEAHALGRFRSSGSLLGLELWAQASCDSGRPSTGLWRGGLEALLEPVDTLVLEPLDFEGSPVGFAALAWGAPELAHYEQLREMLGAATFASSH